MARTRRNKRNNRGNKMSKEVIIERNYIKIIGIIAVVIVICIIIIAIKNYQQSLQVAKEREMLEEKIASIFVDTSKQSDDTANPNTINYDKNSISNENITSNNINSENDTNNENVTNGNTIDNETVRQDIKQETTVNIAIVGDILCGNAMMEDAKKPDGTYNFTHMFSQIDKYVKDSDIAIGTFETNLADNKYSGTDRYNSPLEFAEAVKASGIEVASIAHNHSLDYGTQGLQQTKEKLEGLGYSTIGAKSNLEEKNYIVKEINQIKIAFLAYTYGFSYDSQLSSQDKQYVNVYSDEVAKADLDTALQEADCAIVIMHWGDVNSTSVNKEQERIAQYLIQNGANVIAGSHPSVIETMQVKQNNKGENTFVAYSLGNYISSLGYENSNLEMILNIKISKDMENGKVKLKEAYYTPIYMLDNGSQEESRYTLIDMKQKAKDYLDEIDKSIGKSTYDKLISGLNTLEKIIRHQ